MRESLRKKLKKRVFVRLIFNENLSLRRMLLMEIEKLRLMDKISDIDIYELRNTTDIYKIIEHVKNKTGIRIFWFYGLKGIHLVLQLPSKWSADDKLNFIRHITEHDNIIYEKLIELDNMTEFVFVYLSTKNDNFVNKIIEDRHVGRLS